MIAIGALRRRVSLEEPAPDETWRETARLWAEIRDLSGHEDSEAGAENPVRRVRVTIRFRQDVTSQMRFRAGDRKLAIRAVLDATGLRRFLTCLCEEETARDRREAAGSP